MKVSYGRLGMGNVLVVWVEEDLVNIEGHLPVLGPVHAVLAHHIRSLSWLLLQHKYMLL